MDDDELAEAPEFIYLQVHRPDGEVSWCDEQIEDTDIKYIRVDKIRDYLDELISS